jgi:hypothetical protein
MLRDEIHGLDRLWDGDDEAIVDELMTYEEPETLRELLSWCDLMDTRSYRRIARLVRLALAHA